MSEEKKSKFQELLRSAHRSRNVPEVPSHFADDVMRAIRQKTAREEESDFVYAGTVVWKVALSSAFCAALCLVYGLSTDMLGLPNSGSLSLEEGMAFSRQIFEIF